jgi:predicted lipoprotein with Yx(FWY)xxD motif
MNDGRMKLSEPESSKGRKPARAGGRSSRTLARPIVLGGVLLSGGLLAAACNAAPNSTYRGPARPSSQQPSARQAAATSRRITLGVAHVARLGPVLVTSTGHTLYLFSPDKQRMATCATKAGCTAAWPPLDVGTGRSGPFAGTGLRTGLLGTIKAPDGELQVTYNRWPLYTFSGDTGPGQAKGQGVVAFGGRWSAVTPLGRAVNTSTPVTAGTPPTTQPAPPTTQPAPPTTQPAPPTTQPAPPTTQPAPPTTSGIPQGGGGDGDGDNNGAPSDGDGNI